MPADASIYGNLLAAKPKTALEYQQDYLKTADDQIARQVNQLKLQSAQQDAADQQGYRQLLTGIKPGTSMKDTSAALIGSGNPFAIAKGQAMQKADLDNQSTQSTIAKNNATAEKDAFDTGQKRRMQHLQELVGVNDVPSAIQWIDQAVASSELPADRAAQVKQNLMQNPNSLQQWKTNAIAGGFTLQQQRENEWKQREYDLRAANELVNADGTPNQAAMSAKKAVAKAGASNVSVKVDAKTGESLAKEIGPMLKDSAAASQAAGQQIDAANRIDQALASNKLFVGPGANARLIGAQVGDALGVSGANTQEKLANTRTAMQGLAQLTLAGRQQMRGQGAITESESRLAERANSGDINFTPAEIKVLTSAAKRAARYVQAEHARKLDVVKNNPGLAAMAPFYDVGGIPADGSSGSKEINFSDLK